MKKYCVLSVLFLLFSSQISNSGQVLFIGSPADNLKSRMGRDPGISQLMLDEVVCSNPNMINIGEDSIADEVVIFKGPAQCGNPGGTNDEFCQKLYYCQDGQLIDLDFKNSYGQPWAHVSTGTNPGDKKVQGDLKTPEGTFLVTVKDRNHEYAPGGFIYIDTYQKLGYDARIGIHDVVLDHWIGQRHSEGCPRMYTADMRKLYPLLQKGDPVTIRDLP